MDEAALDQFGPRFEKEPLAMARALWECPSVSSNDFSASPGSGGAEQKDTGARERAAIFERYFANDAAAMRLAELAALDAARGGEISSEAAARLLREFPGVVGKWDLIAAVAAGPAVAFPRHGRSPEEQNVRSEGPSRQVDLLRQMLNNPDIVTAGDWARIKESDPERPAPASQAAARNGFIMAAAGASPQAFALMRDWPISCSAKTPGDQKSLLERLLVESPELGGCLLARFMHFCWSTEAAMWGIDLALRILPRLPDPRTMKRHLLVMMHPEWIWRYEPGTWRKLEQRLKTDLVPVVGKREPPSRGAGTPDRALTALELVPSIRTEGGPGCSKWWNLNAIEYFGSELARAMSCPPRRSPPDCPSEPLEAESPPSLHVSCEAGGSKLEDDGERILRSERVPGRAYLHSKLLLEDRLDYLEMLLARVDPEKTHPDVARAACVNDLWVTLSEVWMGAVGDNEVLRTLRADPMAFDPKLLTSRQLRVLGGGDEEEHFAATLQLVAILRARGFGHPFGGRHPPCVFSSARVQSPTSYPDLSPCGIKMSINGCANPNFHPVTLLALLLAEPRACGLDPAHAGVAYEYVAENYVAPPKAWALILERFAAESRMRPRLRLELLCRAMHVLRLVHPATRVSPAIWPALRSANTRGSAYLRRRAGTASCPRLFPNSRKRRGKLRRAWTSSASTRTLVGYSRLFRRSKRRSDKGHHPASARARRRRARASFLPKTWNSAPSRGGLFCCCGARGAPLALLTFRAADRVGERYAP